MAALAVSIGQHKLQSKKMTLQASFEMKSQSGTEIKDMTANERKGNIDHRHIIILLLLLLLNAYARDQQRDGAMA